MTSPPSDANRAHRTLWLIATAVIAPVALSYAFYYLLPRSALANYGELLPTRPIASMSGTLPNGKAFSLDELKGRWAIVIPATDACGSACVESRLHATRQARTMQGRDRDRVGRALLRTVDGSPGRELIDAHPDLIVARVQPHDLVALPRGTDTIYLVDPLGNLVLAWPRDPDIKALARDLGRVLKASRIG